MKRLYSIILIVTAFLAPFAATIAQTSFKPVNLGSGVNSEYPEFNPVISPDGQTLYFSRADHPENTYGRINTQDIWYSNRNPDGSWGEAKHLPRSVNIGRYNAILAVLDDGNTFLINGVYNRKGTRWIGRGFSLITKTDMENWGKPIELNVKGYSRWNKGKFTTAYMTPDRQYLLLGFSRKANGKKLTVYISKLEGGSSYSKPRELKGGINDRRTAESPFLSPDGRKLYFTTNAESGSDNYDIYVCERLDDTFEKWTKPVALSDTINTANWDSYYKTNRKGSWAYFSSITNSKGKSDIFAVKLFEENPFIKLTGLILNQADQTLMLSDTSYRITINGKEFPGLKVDKSSASYEVTLPLGDLYTIKPELTNWNGISSDIDVRSVKEYTESKLNLYLTSIPYVLVKGKILDTRTNLPVSLEKNPKVTIDGVVSDSVKYDQFSASYQVVLPLGAQYVFAASVPNFTSKSEVVDVTTEKVYQERELNLYVSSLPWVEVKGVIMDNNSFTPIIGSTTPKLLINNNPIDSITINGATGEFTIRLPFGQKYTTALSSPEYNPIDNTLDLSGYVEFTTVKHNVFAEKKDANLAILSGKIINTKTEKPLDPGIIARIRVNGVESRAFRYDSTTASYTLKLPIGFSYDLTPSVYNFYNKYEQVDLTKAAPGTKIPRNFYVTPIEVGQAVNIEYIYFETGKAELKPESFRSLNALVEFLNEYPNVKVEIGGHTDNTGGADANMKISEKRARSVAEYVISMGVKASRIESKGYGLTRPKYNNKTADGRAKNRRVEFTIIGI
jgi:outer membrane protein OmpA-like peptidoglycan-associated protein